MGCDMATSQDCVTGTCGPRLTPHHLLAAGLRAENAMLVVDLALAQPIFTVRTVQRRLGVTYARANGLVGQLVTAGVLQQYDEAVYDRRFTAPDVLAVLLR